MKKIYSFSLCLIFMQFICFSQVVHAEDISELRDLIKDLQKQLQLQEEKIDAMQSVIDQLDNDSLTTSSSTSSSTQEVVASNEKKTPVKNTAKINTKGKLEIESDDGEFKYQIGGAIMVDGALYDNDLSKLGSGTEARRARVFLKGTLWRDWNFKSELGYEGNKVSPHDVYIQYAGFDSTSITLGHFKEPFSLETLTSSKFITFMERSLPTAFSPSRNLGVGIATHGNNWTASAGVFGSGFDDKADEFEGVGTTGRVTYARFMKSQKLFISGPLFHGVNLMKVMKSNLKTDQNPIFQGLNSLILEV